MNRRARESQKKGQQLSGKIGCGPHYRPNYPKGSKVLVSATSTDSVHQRPLYVSSHPQFRPSRMSPHQESDISLIDQSLEEMGFSKSHIIKEHQRQSCRELPKIPGHLSIDRSGHSSVPSPPDVSASTNSLCERPQFLIFPTLLRHSNITKNSESTFFMCHTPSVVNPLPEFSPLSNSLDQMTIFSKIDQACVIYLKNTSFRKQRKQRIKSMV